VRRVLIICLSLLWLSPLGVASAATPRAELTHFVCRQAQNPRHREMAVTAVMRPLSGTQAMEMKFSLLRQAAGARSFTQVHSGDLDKWIHPSDPTLGQRPADVWQVKKTVSDLAGTAVYRLKVTFRWIGSRHRRLDQAVRLTTICRAD
jgi:hypothetical protein